MLALPPLLPAAAPATAAVREAKESATGAKGKVVVLAHGAMGGGTVILVVDAAVVVVSTRLFLSATGDAAGGGGTGLEKSPIASDAIAAAVVVVVVVTNDDDDDDDGGAVDFPPKSDANDTSARRVLKVRGGTEAVTVDVDTPSGTSFDSPATAAAAPPSAGAAKRRRAATIVRGVGGMTTEDDAERGAEKVAGSRTEDPPTSSCIVSRARFLPIAEEEEEIAAQDRGPVETVALVEDVGAGEVCASKVGVAEVRKRNGQLGGERGGGREKSKAFTRSSQ